MIEFWNQLVDQGLLTNIIGSLIVALVVGIVGLTIRSLAARRAGLQPKVLFTTERELLFDVSSGHEKDLWRDLQDHHSSGFGPNGMPDCAVIWTTFLADNVSDTAQNFFVEIDPRGTKLPALFDQSGLRLLPRHYPLRLHAGSTNVGLSFWVYIPLKAEDAETFARELQQLIKVNPLRRVPQFRVVLRYGVEGGKMKPLLWVLKGNFAGFHQKVCRYWQENEQFGHLAGLAGCSSRH